VEAVLPRFHDLALRRPARAALFSGVMAATGIGLFWGFTVDDALIAARVAQHIAAGQGYRFNSSGPVVDAVTPLGWAYLLAPFARGGPLSALFAARFIGAGLWLTSAIWLGHDVAKRGTRVWPLATLACLCPVGLWASAGMETAVVTALVTCATAGGTLGSCCVGLAAAFRPELIPFAFALALGRARTIGQLPRDLALVVGPCVLVALARWGLFGSAYPLAVVAKPSDLTHGFWYALEALLWSGPMWFWLGPGWPWSYLAGDRRTDDLVTRGKPEWRVVRWLRLVPGWPVLDRPEQALAGAIVVHFVAVVLAGGDWMPAYRLFVPVMPAMLRVACHCQLPPARAWSCIGGAFAVLSMLHIAWRLGPDARRIVDQRTALIRAGARSLEGARVVAAPDVGWVGAAFSGDIVDLAGATDSVVAYLPGGHTSKRIGTRLFVSRHVDRVIVLLAPKTRLSEVWTDSWFARSIDYRAAMLAAELGCAPAASLRIPYTAQSYVILVCQNP
jgi:hypothetical protein